MAIALSAALLAVEGVSSFGLALPITGWGSVRMVIDVALALGLAILAATRASAPPAIAQLFRRARPVAIIGAALLLLFTGLSLINTGNLILFTAPARYYVTDVVAFTDECARLTLAGHNPYTDPAGFTEALRRFPQVTPTPLRGVIFGEGDYPAHSQVVAVERRFLAHPETTTGAFDQRTLTSYPALSFLLYLPLVWLGTPDILLLNLLVFLALAVGLVARGPRHERLWLGLTLSATLPLLLFSLIADTEVVALAFILVAWRYRERCWVSAIALGLGCAFRQYCWFFVPFFLLDALLRESADASTGRVVLDAHGLSSLWRASGWREALLRAGGMLGAFLLPNLPFLLASPAAWWSSLWLPLTEPLFPLGVGLVALAKGHDMPYPPAALYTTLELLALAGCLWSQWRWRRQLGEAVPLLALLPLFFAWRSLPNYFAIAPLLALFAVSALARARTERAPVLAPATA
ncbi:MAG TPA: hypothetical protein VF812_11635 [Ktedonobacterales bacterium]